jgi:hypothetical protein
MIDGRKVCNGAVVQAPSSITASGTGDTATTIARRVGTGAKIPLRPAISMIPPPMTELPGMFTDSAAGFAANPHFSPRVGASGS